MGKQRHQLNPAKLKADLAAIALPEAPAPRCRWLRPDRPATTVLLSVLTSVLVLASTSPFNQWYLAYVALVPWALAVLTARSTAWACLAGYLAGVLFWLGAMYFLSWITLVGYVALGLYLGTFLAVAAVPLRLAYHRGWPAWVVLPVAWTGLEFIRGLSVKAPGGGVCAGAIALAGLLAGAWGLLQVLRRGGKHWHLPALLAAWVVLEMGRALVLGGFPWLLLAHSQHARPAVIQIADATGQYGVSFFLAAVNGLAVDLLAFGRLAQAPRPRRVLLAGVAVVAALGGGLLGYGAFRLAQTDGGPGAVVGVVQRAFPVSLFDEGADSSQIFHAHVDGTAELAAGGPLDLVVWPESMLGFADFQPEMFLALDPLAADPDDPAKPLFAPATQQRIVALQHDLRRLKDLLETMNASLLAGGPMPGPAGAAEPSHYNAALLFERRGGRLVRTDQYNKTHPVPFGEYVPFPERTHPLHALHALLRKLVPESMPQMAPGTQLRIFAVPRGASTGGAFRVAPPICYEGLFAPICRQMVYADARKRADLLVNISNDGWFVFRGHGSIELDQHLSAYVFRAVENRVPVVRAVNTGISASIDSAGRVQALVEHQGRRRLVAGVLRAQTLVDDRVSLYSRVGDVFGLTVTVVALAGVAVLLWQWLARRRPAAQG